MGIQGKVIRIAVACIAFAGLVLPVVCAPLSVRLIAGPSKAGVGNTLPASIVVYISDQDGMPKTNLEIPPTDKGTGDLDLKRSKGSKWAFRTLIVPAGFAIPGRCPGTQENEVTAQLRITEIKPDPELDGLYRLTVFPAVGCRGGRKIPVRWVGGEYQFFISYKDDSGQGSAFGVLQVH